MSELPLFTWLLVLCALVLGIFAVHFGWSKRWPAFVHLHPHYLKGLDYLITEQPDRALGLCLKLMDVNTDTIEPFCLRLAVSPARRSRTRHPHPPESVGARGLGG